METRRYYIRVDEVVYGNWHAIGVLEDLTGDEDIAKFLVTLYSSQKQKAGEETSLRCVHCHCPLTLYCGACQCPSHLALPSLPPPPSLSSPPHPTLPPQVLDTSAPLSVTSDPHRTMPILGAEGPTGHVKDEYDTADFPQDDGDHDLNLEIVKTESSPTTCDDSTSTEPAIAVHIAPFTRSKRKKSRMDCTRKCGRPAGMGLRTRNTTTRTSVKKAPKHTGLVEENQSTALLLTETHVQTACKQRKLAETELVGMKTRGNTSLHSSIEENCDSTDQDTPSHTQRKRRPCASQDLEKGHILSVEKRRLAQIHVYDQSFIDRHKLEDESHGDSSRLQRKNARQVLIVKNVPGKRGRKKKACSVLLSSNSQSSSSGEDTVDYQISNAQSNQHARIAQESVDALDPPDDSSQCNQTPSETDLQSNSEHCLNHTEAAPEKYPTLKHILSSSKVESLGQDDGEKSKERLPFRILVSAQKILPLLTSSGNPAHNFYSYFECGHCRKAFTHKRAFNSHVQAHIDKRIHKCTFCDRTFERPCDRIIHEKRHKYECEVCGYKYLEYSMIKEHMKLHVMKCPACPFETSDFCAFKKHKSTCDSLKPTLQCEICGVRLKSQKALSFHIAAIHQNNRPFKCTLCDKSFVLQTKLNSHMRDRHAEGGKRFHCDKCGYRAFHAHSLKVHQMCVHSNERPFKCPHCPSAFARKVYLTIHLRKHTGEKPHRCSECLQTFTQRPSLTRHIRTHHHHMDPSVSKKM
ncbi:uncharacterized protein LOC143274750 [Babylonia areolata]|uniref:uncharacterized protein LOC143274750 n=1 Tax=Babylonia areolata TaxID=304850 RepID=UPI003FCF5109